MVDSIAKIIFPSVLNASTEGAFDVPPSWNELLPDMEFTDVETFLVGVFGERAGKP